MEDASSSSAGVGAGALGSPGAGAGALGSSGAGAGALGSSGTGTGALGSQAYLRRGLLTGDVERAAAGSGPAGRDLEQQRRLADPGLAREQQHGTRHDAATQDAVELADA